MIVYFDDFTKNILFVIGLKCAITIKVTERKRDTERETDRETERKINTFYVLGLKCVYHALAICKIKVRI